MYEEVRVNLRQGLEKLKFDVRMIDLNLRSGVLKSNEVQKHLESLEDAQENAAPLQIDENEGNGTYTEGN